MDNFHLGHTHFVDYRMHPQILVDFHRIQAPVSFFEFQIQHHFPVKNWYYKLENQILVS